MKTKDIMVLDEKLFPLSVHDFCAMLGTEYQLSHLDEKTTVTNFALAQVASIKSACLYIPYSEDDAFCVSAVEKGAVAILSDHVIADAPCIVVRDFETALYRLCERMWELIGIPAVIVSGSEGKTTTKRMVGAVLQTEKSTAFRKENLNTFHGLVYTLQKVPCGSECLVQEVDEKRRNNTRNCSNILKPEIALVTNIAEAHLGYYGSKEALMESFRGITAGMDENGVVIINRDDKDSVAAHFDRKIISVGIDDPTADCLAKNIREGRKGVAFDLCYAGETEHICLSVHGKHNVYNAMMAYVVGKLKGISTAHIKKGLHSYRNAGIRQNICRLGNTLLYIDCYNASATSVSFALQCFDALPAGKRKKVAVLGDIAEIDGFEEDTYRRIAAALDASSIDTLVTCGKDSEMIHSFLTRNMTHTHTRDRKELNQYLTELKKGGGNFLFKASRIMELEKSIRAVFPYHLKWIHFRDKHNL